MQTIQEDIKNGTFRTIYLLFGEEEYLKRQYRDKLVRALVPGGDAMNCARFQGKEAQIPALIDLAETLPFFADYRVIVAEETGFFKNASGQLADYVPDIPSTTVFIFVEKEVDKRGKLYKAVKDHGRAVEFGLPDERMLTRWALGILKRENKKISEPVMRLFLDKAGFSMENMEQELEKLICHVGEREIVTREDVEAICTEQTENRVFEMIHRMAEKRQKEALGLYYDLLALKEPPLRILYLIGRQFNTLLQVKSLAAQGMDNNAIASRAGLRSFTIRRYRAEAEKFSIDQILQALGDCVQAEEDVKTGKMEDRLALELLLVKYSG